MSRTHRPGGQMYRTYDPEEVHEKLWAGWSGAVGWDIGANEGQSVQRMLASFDQVVALEPASESFRTLEDDWGSDPRVQLLNMAAGEESGVMVLSVRLVPMGGGQLVSPELREDGWWGAPGWNRTVPCISLDDLAGVYGYPDFVKIDTEGFEEQILRGATELRARGVDWLIEVHSPELRQACYDLLDSRYVIELVEKPEPDPENAWLLARRM